MNNNQNNQLGFFQQQQNPQDQDFLSNRQNVFNQNFKNNNSFSGEEENYEPENEDVSKEIDELKYLVKETPEDNPTHDIDAYIKYRNSLN